MSMKNWTLQELRAYGLAVHYLKSAGRWQEVEPSSVVQMTTHVSRIVLAIEPSKQDWQEKGYPADHPYICVPELSEWLRRHGWTKRVDGNYWHKSISPSPSEASS